MLPRRKPLARSPNLLSWISLFHMIFQTTHTDTNRKLYCSGRWNTQIFAHSPRFLDPAHSFLMSRGICPQGSSCNSTGTCCLGTSTQGFALSCPPSWSSWPGTTRKGTRRCSVPISGAQLKACHLQTEHQRLTESSSETPAEEAIRRRQESHMAAEPRASSEGKGS